MTDIKRTFVSEEEYQGWQARVDERTGAHFARAIREAINADPDAPADIRFQMYDDAKARATAEADAGLTFKPEETQ